MRVMILSDVHGEGHWFLPFKNSDCDICIQLGDFGFIWDKFDIPYNKFLNKFEKEFPNKTIFTVLGNHENYDLIFHFHKFETVSQYGAECYQIRKNIFAVKRGEILNLDNITFLCVGGADSTDKEWRIETEIYEREVKGKAHRLWWPQEKIAQADIDNAIANVNKQEDKRVNFVCTHAEPYRFIQKIFPHAQASDSDLLLNDLWAQIGYDYWFGGHIHESYFDEENNIASLGIGEWLVIDTQTKEIETDIF